MADTIRLEQNLDLQAAGRLAESLGGLPGDVTLDASEVVHVGGLAAQLILAARGSAGPSGRCFRVMPQSRAFADGLRRLGVDPATLEE